MKNGPLPADSSSYISCGVGRSWAEATLLALCDWEADVGMEVSSRSAVCGGDGSGEVWTEASAYVGRDAG